MKKHFIIIALLGFTLNIQAQDLALHFSGRFADSTATRLDSVTVENLTKKWKETIVYPDTVWEYRFDGIKKTAEGRHSGTTIVQGISCTHTAFKHDGANFGRNRTLFDRGETLFFR